jgi:hypothetical protein
VAQGGLIPLPPHAILYTGEGGTKTTPLPPIGTLGIRLAANLTNPTQFFSQMSVTLTANYKEVLGADAVEKIDELLEDNYALDDILEFVDAHNEEDFVAYYEEYVRCGEAIGYEAVDAFVEEMGCLSYVENCDEKYRGCYSNEAEFAEEFYNEVYGDVPSFLVVDWEATWEQSMRYDFTACRDGSTYRPCHIFSDN